MKADLQKLLNNLARKYLPDEHISINPIENMGQVNEIYVLQSKGSKLVTRVHQSDEMARYKKEQWCIEQAAGQGVLGPKILETGANSSYAYMLLAFIEGQVGASLFDTDFIWHDLGRYAKLINAIEVKGYGETLEDITHGSLESWEEYLTYNVKSLTANDQLIGMGCLTLGISSKLKMLFEELSNKSFNFGLNHGDMSLQNVIVGPLDEITLIGWGSAQGHVVPHHDFGVILSDSLSDGSNQFAAFLEGYGMPKAGFDSIKEDVESLQLLEATDKLRWAIDKKPARIHYCSEQLDKWLKIKGLK